MKKYFYKKIIFILLLIFILFTFACKKLDYQYRSARLLNNLYLANDDMFSDAVAKKIVVPNNKEENIVQNIGAEGYFIASTDRYKSAFTRYHNPFKRLPMASLTKLMTALIVFENCKDLDEKYYVTTDAVDFPKDASLAKLKAGDKVSVKDLLYGLIIPSGNDAAMCLAENLCDSYDNFIIMMNNEAERLGAMNTHFSNPHGLDSEHHFTTAYDLFLITRELIKYPLFREISVAKEYEATIEASDGTVRKELWENTNLFITEELLMSSNVTLLAGKTGTTTNAGNCLVLLTKENKSGDEYISVVLNAKSKRNAYYNSNALISAIKKQ